MCRDQGSNPGTPTYSPLRGEILATRLPNQKKKNEKNNLFNFWHRKI
jgi:hypothetical protein